MKAMSVLSPAVQQLLDHFALCFDVRIGFASRPDASGRLDAYLARGLNLPNARYCSMIQQERHRFRKCVSSENEQFHKAVSARTLVRYECHAGLTEVIIPIFAERYLLGYAIMGQIRMRDTVPDSIKDEWCKHHALEPLEAALQELPFVSEERMQGMTGLFRLLMEYVASEHLVSLPKDIVLGEALDYLETHTKENIRLADLARLVNKSPSTLSHLFSRQLGKSFKQTLIALRLKLAEAFMLEHPGCTVAQAAAAVGCHNPFYFSRLYKRYRGLSPSTFIRTACGSQGRLTPSPDILSTLPCQGNRGKRSAR